MVWQMPSPPIRRIFIIFLVVDRLFVAQANASHRAADYRKKNPLLNLLCVLWKQLVKITSFLVLLKLSPWSWWATENKKRETAFIWFPDFLCSLKWCVGFLLIFKWNDHDSFDRSSCQHHLIYFALNIFMISMEQCLLFSSEIRRGITRTHHLPYIFARWISLSPPLCFTEGISRSIDNVFSVWHDESLLSFAPLPSATHILHLWSLGECCVTECRGHTSLWQGRRSRQLALLLLFVVDLWHCPDTCTPQCSNL